MTAWSKYHEEAFGPISIPVSVEALGHVRGKPRNRLKVTVTFPAMNGLVRQEFFGSGELRKFLKAKNYKLIDTPEELSSKLLAAAFALHRKKHESLKLKRQGRGDENEE